MILEACVENLKEAMLAESLGAGRVELCADLARDGLTPGCHILSDVADQLHIPIKVMLRPRGGNFVYSEYEVNEILHSLTRIKNEKVSGVVFGALLENGELDLETIKKIAKAAAPLQVTIHRAIDLTPDPVKSVQLLCNIPEVHAVLSSGGKQSAYEGSGPLNKMILAAGSKLEIIAAGKITNENLSLIRQEINAQSFHGRKIVGELSL